MTELTKEKIAELRGLLAKATPGPWFMIEKDGRFLFEIMSSSVYVAETSWHDASPIFPTKEGSKANFDLIVAMRNAFPALLDLASHSLASASGGEDAGDPQSIADARKERDQWQERESQTQDALQAIGEDFGAHGGEPRTDAMRRLLTEAREAIQRAHKTIENQIPAERASVAQEAWESAIHSQEKIKDLITRAESALLDPYYGSGLVNELLEAVKASDAAYIQCRDIRELYFAKWKSRETSATDAELLRTTDETLQAMASQAFIPMDLWDKHSNAVLSLMAHIRSLSSRVERAERLAYTGATSLASIDEGAMRPETWKERAENRQAVFLLAKRRAEAAESEAAALRERIGVLEKALEPFAKVDPFHVPTGVWHHHDESSVRILSLDDFRRACTALEGRDA